MFRFTRKDEDRRDYVEGRKRYKYLLKVKKQSFRREKNISLAANLNNSRTLWKELRNMVCVKRDKANISSIDINKSHDHFKDLFVSNVVDENVQDTVQFDISEESGAFF